jgi:hypothetical protein
MTTVRVVGTTAFPMRLAHGTSRHLACRAAAPSDAIHPVVVLYAYEDMRLTVFSTDLSDAGLDETVVCNGVNAIAQDLTVVASANERRYAYRLAPSHVVTGAVRVNSAASPSFAYDPGMLWPLDSHLLAYSWTNGDVSRAQTGDPESGPWPVRFTLNGPGPCFAAGPTTLVFMTRAVDGIAALNGATSTYVPIAPGHRAMAVHHRGAGLFGWFSVTDLGELFYSVGGAAGPWSTETTGIVDVDTLGPSDPMLGTGFFHRTQVDIATNVTTGEPFLVFQAATGDLRYVARRAGIWVAGATPLSSGFQHIYDLKAEFVGCGRPAIEVLPTAPETGWYFMEAR